MSKHLLSEHQESSRTTQQHYDRLSPWYDLFAAGSERGAQLAGLEALGVRPGDSVLEIGCGTGQLLPILARSVGESGKVWGLDLSAGMIARARARLDEVALLNRTTLVQGNALRLPCRDGFCNAVIMSFVLEIFSEEDSVQVVSECRRILTGGGRLCVVALAKSAEPGVPARLYQWAQRRFPKFIDCRPIFVQNIVSQAGLQIRDVTKMGMWGLPIEIVLAKKI